MHFLSSILCLLLIGSAWADQATDTIIATYQAEVTKAGAAFDTQVQAATAKAEKALTALQAKTRDEQARTEVDLALIQLQTGALAPVVVDPRRFDVQPLPWAPLTELGLDGVVVVKAKTGIVELSPNHSKGQPLGYFKAGTVLSIRFVGGMYRIGGAGGVAVRSVVDPDAPGSAELVLGERDATTIAKLPGQTSVTPFLIKLMKDGEYRLRPRLGIYGANLGLGAFEIKLGGG